MAKTYNTFTNVSTGDVLTATNFNNVLTNIAGYRVPPSCQVRRTTDLTSYSSGTAISWESAAWDTESPSDPMWVSGSASRVTFQTNGLYLVHLQAYVTATATVTLIYPAFVLNGVSIAEMYVPVYAGQSGQIAFSQVINAVDGDYLQANVGFVGGSAYVINGSTTFGGEQSRLTVTWLGQVS